MKKEPECKHCGSNQHYSAFCFKAPKKPIKANKPLRSRRTPPKPRKPLSTKKKQKPLKRSQISSHSKSARAILIRRADRVFSLYIRRKDSIGNKVRCVTCGVTGNWRLMQCGHFVSRRKMQLRWDKKNAHVQCSYCNEILGGNLEKYKQYLVKKHGNKILFYLQDKSNNTNKVTHAEIQTIIDEYTTKIKELDKGA